MSILFLSEIAKQICLFLLLCVFYDNFQTKLKKIVTYRGVSFVHLAPPPLRKKKSNYGYERSAKGLSTVMIVSKSP